MDIVNFKIKIKDLHDKFLKEMTPHISKVVSDRQLKIESCSSKIRFICEAFKDLKIISEFKEDQYGLYVVFTLSKENFHSDVKVYNNGKKIIITVDDCDIVNSVFGLDLSNSKKYEVENKSFNWDLFGEDLLDRIHFFMYRRKEADQNKVEEIFKKWLSE